MLRAARSPLRRPFPRRQYVTDPRPSPVATRHSPSRPQRRLDRRRQAHQQVVDRLEGEAGTTGAPPALVNAALDALAPLGVTHLDMPLTPERLWQAIQAAEEQGAGESR